MPMRKNPLSLIDLISFVSNMLAVILGIIITFSIQGIIDRHQEKTNIKSELSLVREALVSCRQDLSSCADVLDEESKAANYFLSNKDNLDSCPKDSVTFYANVAFGELVLTLPDDAMELLKNSSIFSHINDNALSLAIIRAYDQCDALTMVFNRHEEMKSEYLNKMNDIKNQTSGIEKTGELTIRNIMSNHYGAHLLNILSNQSSGSIRKSLTDIDNAIDAINDYLK